MRRDEADRGALAAALLFAILYLISAFVVKAPPKPTTTADAVQRYFVDHADGLRASGYIAMVAGIPYLILLASIRRRLATVPGWLADTAFGAGIVLAGLASVGLLIRLGLALHASETPAPTIASVLDVSRFVAPSATGVVFILALTVGLGGLRFALLPTWASAASIVYAAYEIVESFTVFGDTGAFAPGEAINAIGTIGFLVWAVVVGAGLARGAGEQVVAPAPG
jgi:hypothetical protein